MINAAFLRMRFALLDACPTCLGRPNVIGAAGVCLGHEHIRRFDTRFRDHRYNTASETTTAWAGTIEMDRSCAAGDDFYSVARDIYLCGIAVVRLTRVRIAVLVCG